ncbi:MAG: Tex-like N-terminal domain-containing protein, partial [Gallionella sp.]|nr:Tex-like N-terminal domain-containing protein [Gallionella sp.]
MTAQLFPITSFLITKTLMLPSIEQRLALEISAKPAQVAAAVALLDEGATVPFIARYRKE